MEQNLSDKERKQRLALGILTGSAAVALFLLSEYMAVAVLLGLLATGFIANYFTCFCGTKKALESIRDRIK